MRSYIETVQELASIRSEIMKNETSDTYEATGIRISIGDVRGMLFEYANQVEFPGFVYDEIFPVIEAAFHDRPTVIKGPYNSDYYAPAFKQVFEIGDQIRNKEKPVQSRQFVVQFNKDHCFQNIQFIFRGDTLLVIVNMRSCNFEENFMCDIYIAWFLAETLKAHSGMNYKPWQIDIVMNIGSLHIFK